MTDSEYYSMGAVAAREGAASARKIVRQFGDPNNGDYRDPYAEITEPLTPVGQPTAEPAIRQQLKPTVDTHFASNRTQELMQQIGTWREGRGLDPEPGPVTYRRDGLRSIQPGEEIRV